MSDGVLISIVAFVIVVIAFYYSEKVKNKQQQIDEYKKRYGDLPKIRSESYIDDIDEKEEEL